MNIFFNKNDKGFTLIEVIISLGLTGIIMAIVISLLTSNVLMFENNDKDIELQQQGQFILGFLEDKIMQSTKIIYLQDRNGLIKHNSNDKVDLSKIILESKIEPEKGYIFQLNKDLVHNYYNLKYGKGLNGTATIEVGNYIEKIEVEPIPLESKYIEAKGLSLSILMNFNGRKKIYTTQLIFRNYDGR